MFSLGKAQPAALSEIAILWCSLGIIGHLLAVVVAADVAEMSVTMPKPSQIQSQPFKGKISTYIKAVQGTKIKPAGPPARGS